MRPLIIFDPEFPPKPVVDRVYPMAEIADAHRHVETRHKRGSVIVTTDVTRDQLA